MEIRENCEAGTIGCSACKEKLRLALEGLLAPMRERRVDYAARPRDIDDILQAGTAEVRRIAAVTMGEVREAMGLDYFGRSR
ncbi:Tryptophan--tRNA ligase [compost metagenome]